MSHEQNLFDLTKGLTLSQTKDFMLSHGVEFKGKLAFCPFHSHDHKSPSMGLQNKRGEPFFNCFACGSAGDIVKFAQLHDKVSPLQACVKVLDYFKIPYIAPGVQISDEERAKIEAQIEERKVLASVQKEKALVQEQRLKNFMIEKAVVLAPKLAEKHIELLRNAKKRSI